VQFYGRVGVECLPGYFYLQRLAVGNWRLAVRGKKMILSLNDNWVHIRTGTGGWQLAAGGSW